MRAAREGRRSVARRPKKRKGRSIAAAFLFKPGAQERTRTSTVLPPLGPEPSASTNFATWASFAACYCCDAKNEIMLIRNGGVNPSPQKFHISGTGLSKPEIDPVRPAFHPQCRDVGRRARQHLARAQHQQPRRAQPDRLDRIARLQQHEARRRSPARARSLRSPRMRAALRSPRRSTGAMPSWLVICATCRPMCATSSMSPEPRPYQGSITQSWPKATFTPAAISSGTRVMPRRFG